MPKRNANEKSVNGRSDKFKVDKTYIPPGRVVETKLFVNPSVFEYAVTLGFWSLIGLLSQPKLFSAIIPVNSTIYRNVYGDRNPFINVIFGFITINLGLTAVVAVMGINADIPMPDLIKWMILTPFFGFSVVQPFVKICYKRKQLVQDNDPIG